MDYLIAYSLGVATPFILCTAIIFAEWAGLNLPKIDRSFQYTIYHFVIGECAILYSEETAKLLIESGFKIKSFRNVNFSLKLFRWNV